MDFKFAFGPSDGIITCYDCGTKHHILESCSMCGGGPAPFITDPKDYPLWGIRKTNDKLRKLLKRKRAQRKGKLR